MTLPHHIEVEIQSLPEEGVEETGKEKESTLVREIEAHFDGYDQIFENLLRLTRPDEDGGNDEEEVDEISDDEEGSDEVSDDEEAEEQTVAENLENKSVPGSKWMNLDKIFSAIVDSMRKRVDDIEKNQGESKQLKSILAKTNTLYNQFTELCARGRGNLDRLLYLYGGFTSKSSLFNKKYQEILEQIEKNKKRIDNSRKDPKTSAYVKGMSDDINKMISHLRDIKKSAPGSTKESALRNIYDRFSALQGSLLKIYNFPGELTKKNKSKIENIYRDSRKITQEFSVALGKEIDDVPLVVVDYFSWAKKEIDQASNILSEIKALEQEIRVKQSSWLSAQERINQVLGKIGENTNNNIPGSFDLIKIRNELNDIAKELVNFIGVAIPLDEGCHLVVRKISEDFSEYKLDSVKLRDFLSKSKVANQAFLKIRKELVELEKEISVYSMASAALAKQLTPKIIGNKKIKPKSKKIGKSEKLTDNGVQTPNAVEKEQSSSQTTGSSLQQLLEEDPSRESCLVPKLAVEKNIPNDSKSDLPATSPLPDSLKISTNPFSLLCPQKISDVVLNKLMQEEIQAILNVKIELDGDGKPEKITKRFMEKMYIKQTALLMQFCSFSEGIVQGSANSMLSGQHIINKQLFINVRDFIYHRFPEFVANMQSPMEQVMRYREVVKMLEQLNLSLAKSHCEPLSESKLFVAYSAVKSRSLPPLKASDIGNARAYIAKINAINTDSFGFNQKTLALSNQFIVGIEGIFAQQHNTEGAVARHTSLMSRF